MPDIMGVADRWESGRSNAKCEISEKSEISPTSPDLFSHISLISQGEERNPDLDRGVFKGATPDFLRNPKGAYKAPVVYPPCTCDEKPHPHLRHRDGTGPGSGRALAPYDHRQAHRSRNVESELVRTIQNQSGGNR